MPWFKDLNLNPDIDMLWLVHHDQRTSLSELQASPVWKSRKNIFLLDNEQVLHNEQWQDDSRIHVWSPVYTPMQRSNLWLFWFDWMQEIETHLNFMSKLASVDSKPFLFDALLGTSRQHKDIIDNFVTNSTLGSKIFYRYVGTCQNAGGLHTHGADEELPNGDVMYNKVQIANASVIVPYIIFNQCWYTLVAETSDLHPNFYTEKTGKPLLAKRLFVMFAGKHHLKNLKAFGFRTFDGIIDEGYDDIDDTETRYEQAWKQVEFLAKQDPLKIYKLAQPILEHNHRHFMQTNWKKEMHQTIQNISHSSK